MNPISFGRKKQKPYTIYTNAISEARAAAKRLNHLMGNATLTSHRSSKDNSIYKITGSATCKKCGMVLSVTTMPAPSEMYISGTAIAEKCKQRKEW
jgi:hypothetical protein